MADKNDLDVLFEIRRARARFMAREHCEPNRVHVPADYESYLLRLMPADVGDSLAGEIVQLGRQALRRIYGMHVTWDAADLKVEYVEPHVGGIL